MKQLLFIDKLISFVKRQSVKLLGFRSDRACQKTAVKTYENSHNLSNIPKGTEGMDEIIFASVDVNKYGIRDTAILCDCGDVVGVLSSTNPTTPNLRNSIFMSGLQDTTISKI